MSPDEPPKVYRVQRTDGLTGVAAQIRSGKWVVKTISISPPTTPKKAVASKVEWHWFDDDWTFLDEVFYPPMSRDLFIEHANYFSNFIEPKPCPN